MGRLGPLTSQALGRSPYDDVVEGEGEANPREPEPQYDEKGRIVNHETKTIIKSLIRAHNEVMQVIGVAEPENGGINESELALAKEHQAYESETGRWLLHVGHTLVTFGTWGVHGVRQRILLYKSYSHVQYSKLIPYERTRHSYGKLLLAGLSSYVVMEGLGTRINHLNRPRLEYGMGWIRLHLHLFLTMQQVDLIPASRWIPDIMFFIPFSSSSPFPAPPAIESLNASSIGGWLARLVANAFPYAVFYFGGRAYEYTTYLIKPHIHKRLPQPSRNKHLAQIWERAQAAAAQTSQTIAESPTLGPADREIRHTPHSSQDMHIPTLNALEGQPNGAEPGIPIGAIRRQSTFSNRGGDPDYGTDEEDAEILGNTLISFDVDTSDSTEEQRAGVWSAELRPSYGGDGRPSPKEEPIYVVNPLTSLPSLFAADILTTFVTRVICAPGEALALRMVAKAFSLRRGLPTGHMFPPRFLHTISCRSFVNVFGLELLRLLMSGEVWALTTVLSQWLHVTEEEWKEIHKEEQEAEQAAQQAADRAS
ncbi:uncharacterized protein BCR38DRAFT_330941 [Pseudomassariella vexata]|uniref:Uncharacterized protein n=1 Tax=Pseudomassariella vexata TaxID=1141098 RepID=A0A1Y2EI65_9PEZI|nr:uncharacterized protein BCR38DRAFT_330941 [Pseudomassariella vexata]ORY71253.1 hypothetical protein BCR38DRAFT_330941 [Pseudomassariella vexata]